LSKLTRLDTATLEKYKLNKVILKFAKRGDDYIKDLAQQILDRGERSGKPSVADTKGGAAVEKKADGPVKAAPSLTRAAVSNTKTPTTLSNPIDRKSTSQAPVKPSTGIASKSLPITSRAVNNTKTDGKATGPTAAASIPAKEKIKHVVSKPSVFASLQSASKKPGTSISAQKVSQNVAQAR